MKKTLFFIQILTIFVFSEERRIIGGKVAAAGQFRFIAAIYKTTPDGLYFCSGSVIDYRWILTAGQCVDGATLFTIYLGTNNIKTPSSTSVKLATEEYVLHPDYNATTLENDVGLIKLRMNITYTDYIRSIPFIFFEIADNIGSLETVGWGQTSDDSADLSDQLYWIEKLASVANKECRVTYGDQITDNMVCVAGNYNEGICHGDIGGPLLYPYRGVSLLLSGLSSFVSGNGCESTDPSGYTRIYPYVSWIQNIMRTQ